MADTPKERQPQRRKRRPREETTRCILEAAEELFATRNPSDVTIRDIAARAGVTHSLIHHYVGTKEDLLDAVIQRTDRVTTVKRAATVDDAVQALVPDILQQKLHTKSIVRSAMDGVGHVELADRIHTGRALLALVDDPSSATETPYPPPQGLDRRVILASITAMAFGWVAVEPWLGPIFDFEDMDEAEAQRQVSEIAHYLTGLLFTATPEAPSE